MKKSGFVNRYPEYSFLAAYYDEIMKDVDYEAWAEFLDDVIQIHHPNAFQIHEISCGTGSILIELDRFGSYRLSGSDKSEHMVQVAQTKSNTYDSNLQIFKDDFLHLTNSGSYDVVLSAFDSLNYILDPNDFGALLSSVRQILAPGGLFIFDFTTPAHSEASIEWLDHEKIYTKSGVRILRRSFFDSKSRIHTNQFSVFSLKDITNSLLGEETHIQRAYTFSEIKQAVEKANWIILASYGDFELEIAEESSHRICIVCKPH